MITSYINLKGQVINGLLIGDRTCLRPLRWETECVRCGSTKIFDHTKLLQASAGALNAAHCSLDNCYRLGTARKPIPPTERPEREQREPEAPPVAPAPVPKPIP